MKTETGTVNKPRGRPKENRELKKRISLKKLLTCRRRVQAILLEN